MTIFLSSQTFEHVQQKLTKVKKSTNRWVLAPDHRTGHWTLFFVTVYCITITLHLEY